MLRLTLGLVFALAACGRVEREGGAPSNEVDEVEPNDSCDAALLLGSAVTIVHGEFRSGTDLDFFRFHVSDPGIVEIRTNPIAGDECGRGGIGADTQLTLYNAECTVAIDANDDQDADTTSCSFMADTLEPGTYLIQVNVFVGDAGPELGTDPTYEVELSR